MRQDGDPAPSGDPAAPPPVAATKPPAPAKKTTLPETTEGLPWQSNHEVKKESNPFTERDWRMVVYAWSGLAVRVAILVGGLFSYYQYVETSEEKRMTRTFELLAEWDKPEYQTAQVALRQRITDLNSTYRDLMPSNPSESERAIIMDRIGLAALSENGGTMPLAEFKEHFDRIASFLNRVATCVQANQCSRDVTNDYFRDYAVTFWRYFAKYSRQMRQSGSTTFSVPLEEFVTGKRPSLAQDQASSAAR